MFWYVEKMIFFFYKSAQHYMRCELMCLKEKKMTMELKFIKQYSYNLKIDTYINWKRYTQINIIGKLS